MEITLAEHYGFCQGVKNALFLVEKALKDYPNEEIYLLNKLVHNNQVIDRLLSLGIKIKDENISLKDKILSIDKGVIIFSAHGHDKSLDKIAKDKNLIIIDTTCPRVEINQKSIIDSLNRNKKVIYIGIKNHPETIACLSNSPEIIFIDFFNPDYSSLSKDDHVSIHNQTTLIQKDLLSIYHNIEKNVSSIEIHNDICYATSLRQESLLNVLDEDVIFIIGDKISSNSSRLFEVAKKMYINKDIYMISDINDLKNINISKYKKGFITAGASTPEEVINPIIEFLKNN